jgi:hypothetical protein
VCATRRTAGRWPGCKPPGTPLPHLARRLGGPGSGLHRGGAPEEEEGRGGGDTTSVSKAPAGVYVTHMSHISLEGTVASSSSCTEQSCRSLWRLHGAAVQQCISRCCPATCVMQGWLLLGQAVSNPP